MAYILVLLVVGFLLYGASRLPLESSPFWPHPRELAQVGRDDPGKERKQDEKADLEQGSQEEWCSHHLFGIVIFTVVSGGYCAWFLPDAALPFISVYDVWLCFGMTTACLVAAA